MASLQRIAPSHTYRQFSTNCTRNKQYKAQLTKWGLKKNMSVSDAATVLHLINTTTSCGIEGQVSFNDRSKTRGDILRYISKSAIVQSETDLLDHLPPEGSWSPQLKWTNPRNSPSDVRKDPIGYLPAFQYPGSISTEIGSNSSSSYVFLHQGSSFGVSHDKKFSDSGTAMSNGQAQRIGSSQSGSARNKQEEAGTGASSAATVVNNHLQSSQLIWSDEDYLYPNDTSGSFDDVVGPMAFNTFEEPFLMVQPQLEQFNRFMSSTPEPLTEEECDSKIESMLGRYESEPEIQARSGPRNFLRFSCMAALYDGQRDKDVPGSYTATKSSQAISSAVTTFSMIVNFAIDDSLALLNNMVYLLSMYGQMQMAMSILEHIKKSLGADDCFPTPAFVCDTLNFMTSITEPGSASLPCYDLQRLKAAVEAASSIPNAPRLALAAKYNLAWALLEMQQSQEAAEILMRIVPDCEQVFGPHHVQTVTCVSTLARAHLYTGRMVAGERLIDEVMGPRIEKAFSCSHPLYWEFKNRQALFARFRANNLEGDERARRCEESEHLLRNVLEWRVANLGPNNQQTQRTFRVLRNFYIQSARFEEANSLHAVLRSSQDSGHTVETE